MKKRWMIGMAAMMAVSVSACAKSETPVDTTEATQATTTEAATTEAPTTMPEETSTEAAYEPDYMSTVKPLTDFVKDSDMDNALMLNKYSDANAVADVMRKAAKGEKITIACIGGSITQGTISNGAKDKEYKEQIGWNAYANLFFDWWKKAYPDTEVECINAGIGATGSYLAMHRVQKDVLDKKPDLVLVEFSVNDAGVKNHQYYYENLIRTIRGSEGNPAVMLLFMAQTNGSSAQNTHQELGIYYNLPMISYGDMIRPMMKENIYTAEELSGDTVHPSVLGHAIVGETLWKYLNDISAHLDTIAEEGDYTLKDALHEREYSACEILDSLTIEPEAMGNFEPGKKYAPYPNDWTTTDGSEITFKATFKSLGAIYFRLKNGKGAKYDVYVDDEKVGMLNGDFKGGWGSYGEAEEVYFSDEAKEHTVTFRKAENSTGDIFTLCGLMISK